MASILSSQGVVLATAMAAVSGTVILLALRLQKSLPGAQFVVDPIPQSSSQQALRSCILSDGKRGSEKKTKKKKRVHFAEDVVDPVGYSDEFKRQHGINLRNPSSNNPKKFKVSRMPANRVALYNGILRDRVVNRLACSY